MSRAIILFSVVLCTPLWGASAYVLTGDHWVAPTTAFHVSISHPSNGPTSPSGVSWDDAFVEGADAWSSATPFHFATEADYSAPCDAGDSRNGVDFALDVCGNAFGTGVIAVTLSVRSGAIRLESEIIFNASAALQWDVFHGIDPVYIDFRRVAAHELGHALCLTHENDIVTLMNSVIGETEFPSVDELAGVEALYGGGLPGNVASFLGLELPPGFTNAGANDLSGDGSTAVGVGNNKALYWDTGTGVATRLAVGLWQSRANGVSGDGSTIVGNALYGPGSQPVRWIDGIPEYLGEIDGEEVTGNANAISSDGRVIVGGVNTDAGHEVVRWVDGEVERLSGLVGGRAWTVSEDGSVIGGQDGQADSKPFRWENGSFVNLEGPIEPWESGAVWGMTPDGSILYGRITFRRPDGAGGFHQEYEAIRWVNGVMESMGDLPGGPVSAGFYAANAAGNLIGGGSWNATRSVAVVWDPVDGLRELKPILEQEYGLDLSGWILDSVLGISSDGSVLTGFGRNPDGDQQPWVVAIPEPSGGLTLPAGLVFVWALGRWRRRRNSQ
jgi:uncharacterized membrane protein